MRSNAKCIATVATERLETGLALDPGLVGNVTDQVRMMGKTGSGSFPARLISSLVKAKHTCGAMSDK